MNTAIRRRGRHAAPGRRTLREQRDALAAERRALAEENAELRQRIAELTTGQTPVAASEPEPEQQASAVQPGPDSEDTVTLPRPAVRPVDMATGLGATTTHRVTWLGASPLAS